MSAIVYWIFLNSSSSLLVSHPGAWKESSAKPLSINNIKKDNVKYKTLNLNKMKKNNTKKKTKQNKTGIKFKSSASVSNRELENIALFILFKVCRIQ